LQFIRGAGIWLVALLISLILLSLQFFGVASKNVYSNPILPYLIMVMGMVAVLDGLNSTKMITASRDLNLGRLNVVYIFSQILSVVGIVLIARWTASAWAFVVGSILGAALTCLGSHKVLIGLNNFWSFDREVARKVLQKSKWILLSSPLTFLELNGATLVLGLLLSANDLGLFMIGFMIIGVVQLISQNLSANVVFPALSEAVRSNPEGVPKAYARFQLFSDAIILVIAGGLIAAGPVVVGVLFDSRYALSGKIISILAIGLIGSRYFVIEQLINAYGDFRLNPLIISCRVIALGVGTLAGHHFGGIEGAAFGAALSWFAAWPIALWYRAKKMSVPWRCEVVGAALLILGYGLGLLFVQIVHWSGWRGMHHAL
jgi:O-antigen/teichoic acid export membrane protein